ADDVGDDERVGIFRVHVWHRFVDAAGRSRVRRRAHPALAAIVRSIDAGAVRRRFDGRVEAARIARRGGELGVDEAVAPSLLQWLPGRPAVGRLEDAAVGAVPRAVLPRALPLLPQRREDDVGVRRIDVDVFAAGVLVLEEHALERAAAVERAEDAALLV